VYGTVEQTTHLQYSIAHLFGFCLVLKLKKGQKTISDFSLCNSNEFKLALFIYLSLIARIRNEICWCL